MNAGIARAILLTLLGLSRTFPGIAQPLLEVEPNSTCKGAQALGSAAQPLAVAGGLAAKGSDVDFFRVTATPGALIRVVLEGQSTNQGTLADPYLGVFDSSCSLLAGDDDGGGGLNSRILTQVPADGTVVIAATSVGDYDFTGQGFYHGTYRLSIDQPPLARALSGRVVSASTGDPLASAYVELHRCTAGSCLDFVDYGYSDGKGGFRFETNGYFQLDPGDYRIFVWQYAYQPGSSPQVTLAAGQDLDLGDIALTPVPRVSSISVGLVDAFTHAPLRGDQAPYARVSLEYCDNDSYCGTVRYGQATDASGQVRFEGNEFDPLFAGTYRVIASADQYEEKTSRSFAIGESEDFFLGNVGVKSFPVRINLLDVCSSIPPGGGSCRAQVQISNGMPGTLNARVWTVLRAQYTGSPAGFSSFEAPGARPLALAPGQSTEATFRLTVPGSLAPFTYICADGYVAPPGSPFETLGMQTLFCIYKDYGGFRLAPEAKRQELSIRNQSRPSAPEAGRRPGLR